MALVIDTGALYAWYDRDDGWHDQVRALFEAEERALIVPSPIIAEVDHLLATAIGVDAQMALYGDLSMTAFLLVDLTPDGYRRVIDLNRRYRDLRLDFVDAAVMATAEQLGVGRIATTDRRDFGAVTLEIAVELLPN